MSDTLQDKVALVTGGGSGIGRATSLAFAREGAKVVVADVAVEDGQGTVRTIQDSGGEAIFVRVDVSKTDDVEAMIKAAVETYGRLDCAHNNAGTEGAIARTHEYPEDEWDRVIGLNLTGVWLCMKHEIPQMLLQGGGSIVNTSSAAGLIGIRGQPSYVASKHGVAGLTKVAALEYARRGIRVNAVCPGVVNTPMLQRFVANNPEINEEQIVRWEPVGRLGTPEEIAEAVVWLCSDAASFVTGHTMSVDGGMVVQ